jgi:hypothetical protein
MVCPGGRFSDPARHAINQIFMREFPLGVYLIVRLHGLPIDVRARGPMPGQATTTAAFGVERRGCGARS